MNLKKTFLLLFILFVFKHQCSLLDETFVAVERVIAYYKRNVHKMIIDGVFGLRYFEGQFLALENFAKKNKIGIIEDSYFKRMKVLAKKANKITREGIKALKTRYQDYFDKVGWLVLNPYFNANFSTKHVSYHPSHTPILWFTYEGAEDFVDSCISDVTRNAPFYDKEAHKLEYTKTSHCHIKAACMDYILNMQTGSYILTHQLILVQIYHMVGCGKVFESLLPTSMTTRDLIGHLCTLMLHEMSMYHQQHGSIPEELEDLFAEQSFLCPSEGYYEFLHADWLQQFMKGQLPIGCFVLSGDVRPTSRRLLRDATMDDTCSNHKTAVVFSALTQYITTLILANHAVIRFDGPRNSLLPSINYIKNPHLLPASNQLSLYGVRGKRIFEHTEGSNVFMILLFLVLVSLYILKTRLFSAFKLLLIKLCKIIYKH